MRAERKSKVLRLEEISGGQTRFGVRRNFLRDVRGEGDFLNRHFVASIRRRHFVQSPSGSFADRDDRVGLAGDGRRRSLPSGVTASFKGQPGSIALHHVRGDFRGLLF